MDFFENEYFRMTRKCLLLIGQWPRDRSRRKIIPRAFICFLTVSAMIMQIAKLVTTDITLDLLLDYMLPGVTCLMLTTKYCTSWKNTQPMREILNRIESEWNSLSNEAELKIAHKYAKIGKIYGLFYMWITDLLYINVTLHTCGRYCILSYRLEHLFDDNGNSAEDTDMPATKSNFSANIGRCVEYHRGIIDFINILKSSYMYSYVIQLFLIVVTLTGFTLRIYQQLVLQKLKDAIGNAMAMIGILFAVFLNIYPGQMMFDCSIEVFIKACIGKLLTAELDVEVVVDTVSPILILLLCFTKYCTCWLRADKIKGLLERIKQDWNAIKAESELQILRKHATMGRLFNTFYMFCLCSGISIFSLMQFVPGILDVILPLNESRARHHPFQAEYFVDSQKYFYPILCHMLVAAAVIHALAIAADSVFMVFILHACAIFCIVNYRLEHTFDELLDSVEGIRSTQEYKKYFSKIGSCVEWHERAIQFARHMKACYLYSYLLQLLLAVIILTGLLLRFYEKLSPLADLNELAINGIHALGLLFIIFLNIYPAQMMTDRSAEVFHKAYSSYWYLAPVKVQKMMLLIMQRSTEPYELSFAGVVSATVPMFATTSSFSLLLIGQWPYQKSKLKVFQGLFISLCGASIVIALVCKLITTEFSLNLFLEVIFPITICALCYTKYYTCWYNAEIMVKLLNRIKEDWETLVVTEEIRILEAYAEKGRIFGKLYLSKFVQTINSCYSVSSIIQLVLTICILTSILLQLFENLTRLKNYNQIVVCVVHATGLVFMIFLNIFPAQKLLDCSSNIFNSVYNAQWYFAPLKIRRVLPLIMRRCLEPTGLTWGKVLTSSLEIFLTIIQMSLSYFTSGRTLHSPSVCRSNLEFIAFSIHRRRSGSRNQDRSNVVLAKESQEETGNAAHGYRRGIRQSPRTIWGSRTRAIVGHRWSIRPEKSARKNEASAMIAQAIGLLLIGQWPYEETKLQSFLRAFISCCGVSSVTVLVCKLFTTEFSLNLFLEVFLPTTICAVCYTKYFTCWYNAEIMKSLLNRIKKDWEALVIAEEIQILEVFAEQGRIFGLLYIIVSYCGLSFFVSVPFIPAVLDTIDPLNESRPHFYPFPAEYFVDQERYFYPTVIHLLLMTVVILSIALATDLIYMLILLHGCGLFSVLGYRLEHVFDDALGDAKKVYGDDKNRALYQRVSGCVEYHKESIMFVNSINSCYSNSSFIQLALTIAILTSIFLRLFESLTALKDYNQIIVCIVHGGGLVLIVFLNIFPAQGLLDTSSNVFYSASNLEFIAFSIHRRRSGSRNQDRSNVVLAKESQEETGNAAHGYRRGIRQSPRTIWGSRTRAIAGHRWSIRPEKSARKNEASAMVAQASVSKPLIILSGDGDWP
ncbi:hypothetical protein KM043_007892 [Ampulex compressa]|nr:hypothetical protein KM043_007892 [Ampulex compressa]